MEITPFELLPVEVIYQILDKLPVKMLSIISRVSRIFYNSCQDERLWKKKFIKFEKITKEENPSYPFESKIRSEVSIFPSSRLCHISVVWGGYMWVHGGHNTQPETQTFSEVKSDLWKYKFEEKTWEQVIVSGSNLPAKSEHSAVIYNNKMYLFGGYSGEKFTNTLYCYDMKENQCSLIDTYGQIPSVRSAHVGVVYKDKMYIFGGWNGIDQNNDLYSLNLITFKWKKIHCQSVIPNRRCSHAAIVSEKYQSMFVFAGYGGKEKKYLNDVCQYNFLTETWKIIDHTLPSPRSRMRIVEFQEKIYIYGGWNKVEHYNNLYQYDLDRQRWNEVQLDLEPDEGRIGQHSMIVYNNILYIFAGYNSHTKSSTNDLYVYRLSKPEVAPFNSY